MHKILCITDNHRHMFLSTFIGYSCTKLHFQHFVIIFSSFLHIIIGFTYKHILCVSQSAIRTNTFFSLSLLVFQAHNFQWLLNMYSILCAPISDIRIYLWLFIHTLSCTYLLTLLAIRTHNFLRIIIGLSNTHFLMTLLAIRTHNFMNDIIRSGSGSGSEQTPFYFLIFLIFFL